MTDNPNPGNFANRPKEEVQEIASMGGKASSSDKSNPGNFANRPTEEVQEIASKGGQASGGGQTSGGDQTSGGGQTSGGASTGGTSAAEDPGRNADGTFKKGSETASELGAIGGSK